MAQESLKKIIYDNLNQFVEDVNRNFAIIQNSPLYKGIPGDEGDQGKTGLTGERGSHFYFVKLENFLQQYPKEIVNGSNISIDWINAQLQSLVSTKKLIDTLGITDGKFVNNDVIVLTSSEMIEYDVISNTFIKTGISFYQQGSLVTSIEQRIEQYVQKYVSTNPIINSLRNVWIDYATFAATYSETNNTYITSKEASSAIYSLSLNGGDVTGVAVNTHKYFGYSTNMVESGKASTTVLGSISDYKTLIQNTISVISKYHYNSTYAPNKTNIPTLVLLQDTTSNGLMFGYKGDKDSEGKQTFNSHGVARFGSIFKDYEPESNIHIKSDQGDNPSSFSEILLNRVRLYYAKQVQFGDDLILGKDLHVEGNFNSQWIRTAEFIKTKYAKSDVSIIAKVFEIGKLNYSDSFDEKYVSDNIYRNIFKTIELPAFSSPKGERVVMTIEPLDSQVKSDYLIEESQIDAAKISNLDLNDLLWTPTENQLYHLVSSNHLTSLIKKINAIQQYVKENYWRRDEWESTSRTSRTKDSVIKQLNVASIKTLDNVIFGVNNTSSNNRNYFTSSIENQQLTIGFENNGNLLFRANKNVTFSFYNGKLIDDSKITVVTANDNGSLTKEYGIFSKSTAEADIYEYLTSTLPENSNYLIPTIYHLGLFASLLKAKLTKTDNETWHKKDFTKNANTETGEDLSSIIESGNIPNIFVKGLVGGNRLSIGTGLNTLTAGTTSGYFSAINQIQLLTNKLIFNSKIINVPSFGVNKFVTVDSNNNLVTVNEKFASWSTEAIPNTLTTVFDKESISNPDTKILTAKDLLWLNSRINKITEIIANDYYTKAEYYPENNIPVIPKLYLSDELKVKGNVYFGPLTNFALQYDGTKTTIGKSGNSEQLYFRSGIINFVNSKYFDKVLVTNNSGDLRSDITLCTDTSDTENNDNLVPTSITDNNNLQKVNEVKNSKTTDEHKVITGKQWAWLHTFINSVKQRFINTFNRKETIDYVYDHMPVGSIVMWTEASYQALIRSLTVAGKNLNDYITDKVPNGWIICDGREIPKINGSTMETIYTPDLVDKFVRGVDSVTKASSIDGSDFITIERKHLPDLTHAHTCDDIINEHTHQTTNGSTSTENFIGTGWSNKSLSAGPSSTANNYVNIKGANQQNILSSYGWKKSNFEIPMMYKTTGSTANVFQLTNFRHKKDDKDANWRRYDFECSNTWCTVISANLTTIFENFSKISVASAKVLISHTIDDFNIGTGNNSDIQKQEQIQIVPRHYKVVYIMKYDTRYDTNLKSKDSRYNLV